MIDVNLESLQKEGQQGRNEHLRLTLKRRRAEHQPEANEASDAHDKNEQEAADPAVVRKGADI